MSPDAPTHDPEAIRNGWDDDEERLVRRVYAALNSGRDAAVVKVVLDETETLRAQRDELREGVRVACGRFEVAERLVTELRDTLEKRSDALNRAGASNDELRATIERVRATTQLLRPDDITPQGARMLNAALGEVTP